MRTLIVLAVVATLFAGCSKAPVKSGDELQQDALAAGLAANVPTWALGDYWSYDLKGETVSATVSYVVAEDQGTDWFVKVNDIDQALRNARFDFSNLGEIRKSDLAGSQGSDRVKYFDWPLEHNKTWTTQWDGNKTDMVAHALGDGTFHIQGDVDGVKRVEIEYDNATRWFTSALFFDEEEVQTFSMELSGSGTEFSGTVYDYILYDPIMITSTGPIVERKTFSVDAAWNEMVVGLHWNCAQSGEVLIGVQPSNDTLPQPAPPVPNVNEPPAGTQGQCPGGDYDEDMVLNPKAGTWYADFALAGPDVSAFAHVEGRTLLSQEM